MTPEQNCCFGLRNGKGNKKPLSYEKFGNIVLEERNLFGLSVKIDSFYKTINKSDGAEV